MKKLLFADVFRMYSAPWSSMASWEFPSMSSRYGLQADDMLRSCTFVDLVKCRDLVAAVVGCAETCCAEAETRCAEACCAEAFAGGNAGLGGHRRS